MNEQFNWYKQETHQEMR